MTFSCNVFWIKKQKKKKKKAIQEGGLETQQSNLGLVFWSVLLLSFRNNIHNMVLSTLLVIVTPKFQK